MSEDPNHRRPTDTELAAMIEHRRAGVEAAFAWPIIAWSILGMGALAYAIYTMTRG